MEQSHEIRLVGADRVLAVMSLLAAHPDGMSLDELARKMSSPKPTIHRALATLRRAGFAEQLPGGSYTLGDEFLRLAFTYHEARPENGRVQSALEYLANRFGETAHYAVLDGYSVVYRAKSDPPSGAIRFTTTVGGRNPAHATGVGKLLLTYALRDEDAVRNWIGERSLERRTDRTLTTAEQLHEALERIRQQGYAIDDQESETGVNCLAVPVFLSSPTVPSGAMSISALAYRTPVQKLIDDLSEIRAATERLRSPRALAPHNKE